MSDMSDAGIRFAELRRHLIVHLLLGIDCDDLLGRRRRPKRCRLTKQTPTVGRPQ
jgi:hypothetical protein